MSGNNRYGKVDMGVCMKTTVEIPDQLLAQARRLASREKTTVRSLIEEGLRRVLGARRQPAAFTLRKASFAGGEGLAPDAAGGWPAVRDKIYEGRGA